MKIYKILFTITVGALFTMCTTVTRPAKSPTRPSDFGYSGSREATFYYTEGVKYSALRGNPAIAAKFFDKAIELDSLHSPSYFAAANNLALADPAIALEYSGKANSIDTANVWYKSQLGRLMILNGKFDDALKVYRKLVRVSPENPENYRMLAALYEHTNLPFAAIAVLDSAEYKLGRIEELSSYKRELLVKAKLYDKAIAETHGLINDQPYNYGNYLALAELYSITGKDSLALANFATALDLNPRSAEVLAAMNDYYKTKGDNVNYLTTAKQLFLSDELTVESKIKFFEDITRDRGFYGGNFFQISDLVATLLLKYPDNREVFDLYAGNMIAAGNAEEALRIYKGSIGSPMEDRSVYTNIIDLEAYLGRSDSVNIYIEAALRRFPDDPDLYMRHGYALSYMGRNEDALKAFEKAMKYSGSDSLTSVILGIMGDTHHQQNNRKSYQYYERALKLDADNIVVLNNYAYYLSEENRELQKALTMAERVMELAPGNSTYLDTYGWILFRLGRYEEARKVIQHAVSLDRTSSKELFIHYGDVLYELGDHFMATVYWKKALAEGYDEKAVNERLKKTETK